ncbi:MAG: hypothetical protein L0Y71_13565 [Gemmataceae bacterium]|nr:hypothetical protein [Gemmataceae bacterium]
MERQTPNVPNSTSMPRVQVSLRLPCVLFALERERLFFHDVYRVDRPVADAPCAAFLCSAGSRRIVVLESGVGGGPTRRALDWLLNRPTIDEAPFTPSFVLCAGFAGALHASVSVGDVILANEVVDLDGQRWSAVESIPPPPLRGGRLRGGRLLTSSRFVGDPAEKLALGEQHGALAVDMESAAFARRCHERGVPWACLRVISDDVSVPFTTEVAGLVEDGRVRPGRVLSLLLRKPWLVPKLVRLARQTRLAARRLADAVVQFLACSSDG